MKKALLVKINGEKSIVYPKNNDELVVGDILITGKKLEELL